MKNFLTLIFIIFITVNTGCSLFETKDKFTPFTPQQIQNIIFQIQQAVHLSSGTLASTVPPIKLKTATINLAASDVVSVEGGVGILVLTATGGSSETRTHGMKIVLNPAPLPVIGENYSIDNATYSIDDIPDASTESSQYVVLQTKAEPISESGKLAAVIVAAVKGISKAGQSNVPFLLESLNLSMGFSITKGAEAGVVGLALGQAMIGVSAAKSKNNTNAIELSFEP